MKKLKKVINQLIYRLKNYKIPLLGCRGQDYDNSANMPGKIKEVQSHFLEKKMTWLYTNHTPLIYSILCC